MKFEKVNIPSTKGLRKGKHDDLMQHFEMPGDTLQFDEEEMSRSDASQLAIRFKRLTGKPFHSFFNDQTNKVCIRVRTESEKAQPSESQQEIEDSDIPGLSE